MLLSPPPWHCFKQEAGGPGREAGDAACSHRGLLSGQLYLTRIPIEIGLASKWQAELQDVVFPSGPAGCWPLAWAKCGVVGSVSDTSSVRRAPGASVGDFTADIFLPLLACHDPALS